MLYGERDKVLTFAGEEWIGAYEQRIGSPRSGSASFAAYAPTVTTGSTPAMPRAPVREDGTPSDPNHPWNRRK